MNTPKLETNRLILRKFNENEKLFMIFFLIRKSTSFFLGFL